MTHTASSDWRLLLRENFTHLDKLADYLELTASQKERLAARPRFALNIPKRLAAKMTKGSLSDPLLLQFVPLNEELSTADDFVGDPVGDAQFRCAPKLLHKYNGRALLLVTSACAMHCRYCFRQNFEYEVKEKGFAQELAILAADPTIKEVILSGGDPLSLPDETLKGVLDGLSSIPHLRRVRFHSRFPVGIPERVNASFIELLRQYKFSYWFVAHVNHARELDDEVLAAFERLLKAGIPVLNQSVLLRGVNDSVEVQRDLCEKLIDHGIYPYYLHQLDRVQGAKHFEVSEDEGRRIIAELAKQLPGYGVPKYVREICGEPNKTPLTLLRSPGEP